MRRGQTRRVPTPGRTFTKAVLIEAAGVSPGFFDTIRKAARVRGPGHGGLSWIFSEEDLRNIIQRAQSGTFSERGAAPAAAWQALLDEPEADEIDSVD